MEKEEKMELNKEKKLKEPPPRYEKVNATEVWLLDKDDNRIKRICGVQKRGWPEGYVCENEAGKGTEHFGYGPCNLHEPKVVVKRRSMWKRIHDEDPDVAPSLNEALGKVEKIEKGELSNISHDIELLYALLFKQLEAKEGKEWTAEQSAYTKEIIMDIVKAKEAKNRMEKSTLVSPKLLRDFIHQVFAVIQQTISSEQESRKVMERILDSVIIPLNPEKSHGEKVAKMLRNKYGAKKTEGEIEDGEEESSG